MKLEMYAKIFSKSLIKFFPPSSWQSNYLPILFFFKSVAKNSAGHANDDPSEPLGSPDFTADALHALNCLTILTRSTHNCKVFSYYGGVQKITALLKGTWI